VYLHHRDGHRVPVLVRIGPIRDEHGAITGAVETFSDNSQNYRSRQELEALRMMALIDPLTGVGNRRYAQDTLEARLNERDRYHWECGVIFCDVDHFKSVNDTHGHDTGDRVLRMVAQTLANAVRGFDFVGRWGGEEFVIILTHADQSVLHTIAERCRALVQGSSVQADEGALSVTLSLGATLAGDDDNVTSLLDRADAMMYVSKNSGRNQVTLG
jgi:diguanylate cyclase (GGDEF)-like protein